MLPVVGWVRRVVIVGGGILLAAGCDTGDVPRVSEVTAVELPAPHSAGARLLEQYCSNCHGVPLPDSHPPEEWPAVLRRMQHYRTVKGHGLISEPELNRLLGYLQRYAGEAQ